MESRKCRKVPFGAERVALESISRTGGGCEGFNREKPGLRSLLEKVEKGIVLDGFELTDRIEGSPALDAYINMYFGDGSVCTFNADFNVVPEWCSDVGIRWNSPA